MKKTIVGNHRGIAAAIIKTLDRNVIVGDPENVNLDRAMWAAGALAAFMKETGLGIEDGLDTAILDLLGDVAHLCDHLALSFEEQLRRGASHYRIETTPQDDDEAAEHGRQFDFLKKRFDENELATVLAALRMFQKNYEDVNGDAIANDWPEHFTRDDGSRIEPLGTEDIDSLCERINLND